MDIEVVGSTDNLAVRELFRVIESGNSFSTRSKRYQTAESGIAHLARPASKMFLGAAMLTTVVGMSLLSGSGSGFRMVRKSGVL